MGEGARMKEVYQFLKRVAPTESTVLIEGESGTGKELAARALHRNSPRAGKPFVAINCAAIPETLLESDLFGHERGAFTGAASLEERHGLKLRMGAWFFSTRSENWLPRCRSNCCACCRSASLSGWAGRIRSRWISALIAATNCNLEQAVREGRFRQDLYYRLAVLKMTMPTLRDRSGRYSDAGAAFRAEACQALQSEAAAGFARSALVPGEL